MIYDYFGSLFTNTDFQVNFWSSLFSAIVASIITGLIIWIIVTKISNRIEINKERQKNEKEYDVLKSTILTLYRKEGYLSYSSNSSDWLPSNLKEAIEIIEKQPLYIWNENISEKTKLELNALYKSLKSLDDFYISSSYLDNKLYELINKEFDTTATLNIYYGTSVCMAIILDFNDDIILRISTANQNRIDRFKEEFKQEPFPKLINDYIKTRNNAIDQFQNYVDLVQQNRNKDKEPLI